MDYRVPRRHAMTTEITLLCFDNKTTVNDGLEKTTSCKQNDLRNCCVTHTTFGQHLVAIFQLDDDG